MYFVFIDSVGEVLLTSVCRTVLQYIAKIRKGSRNSLVALLVDLPRFHTALISRSSESRRVLLLCDFLLQVRII